MGLSLVVLVVVASAQTKPAATLILHNGRVYTVDVANRIEEAVAIDGTRIVFAGSNTAALALRTERTRVIDLRGAAVVPGFHDAHGHFAGLGATMQDLDLRGTRSFEEVVGLVRRRVATARPGEWILGRGWDQNDWPDTGWPAHELLSAASPDNPVYLRRVDGHAGLANRAAMNIGQIGRATADPSGGRLIRAEDGEPTGVLIDTAEGLVTSRIPPVGVAQLEDQIMLADAEARRLGITTVHDAGTDGRTVEAYTRLIDAGRLKTRLYVMLRGSQGDLEAFFRRGPLESHADHRLAVRAVKIMADGALGSRGAALLEPYSDERATSGLLVTPPEAVYAQTLAAARAGFQPAVHAIGDRANRIVMDVFERVQREVPGSRALRMRVEHAQILDAAEIPRFASLGVVASMQPTHATSDMPWAPTRVGEERISEGAYAWRKLLTRGAVIASGSDFPVEEANPMLGLYAAVTRQDPTGNPPGGWTAGERMTRAEAIASFTRHAAWAAHAEAQTGSIESGKLADLVVLSKDVMQVPVQEILATTVRMTVVGGEVVYDRPSP